MPTTPTGSGKKRRKKPLVQGNSFYKKHKWRRVSELYRIEYPLCEVSKAMGLTVAANLTDHVVRIESGGAEWNEGNFMAMSNKVHQFKRSLEARGFSIKAIQTEDGLIPASKEVVIKSLLKAMKKPKINVDGSRSI